MEIGDKCCQFRCSRFRSTEQGGVLWVVGGGPCERSQGSGLSGSTAMPRRAQGASLEWQSGKEVKPQEVVEQGIAFASCLSLSDAHRLHVSSFLGRQRKRAQLETV